MKKLEFLTPEFIESCNACGIPCDLSIFPWKYLGYSDEEFMALELWFEGGHVIPKEHQQKLLGVVRAQERQLRRRFELTRKRKPYSTKNQLEMF
jgi:hypothetical protein